MVAVITGPTASGKSALALALAERCGGTIINADASQLYADLRLISARPSPADEARVPHRLYGDLDGDDVANAARWAGLARAAIGAEAGAGRLPILVGGTGLYLTTLIDGIAPVPEIAADVRAAVRSLATADAAAALAREDAALAARLHPTDRQRLLRGLEVVRATGRSLLDWQRAPVGGIAADHDVRAMVVEIDRDTLRARVAPRLWAMLGAGGLDEVAALVARRLPADRPVLRALGVPQFAALIDGSLSRDAAVAAAATATQQYQKRQLTWARSQARGWPRVGDVVAAAALLGRCDQQQA
jgi:tRNA dimethylallyltransferase